MYEIELTRNAKKQLKKLDRDIQERIIAVLARIRIRPTAFLIKLVGESGYKLRVGDYRVIVDLIQDKLLVLVIKIGHRKKVYKKYRNS